MKVELKSNFKQQIESFIAEKRTLGFKYYSQYWMLARFDQMCFEHFPQESKLTKEIGDKWATLLPTEKRLTLMDRIGVIREFGRYLIRIGIDAYLPEQVNVPPSSRKYPAHIFTDTELSLFFAAADRFEHTNRTPIRHLIVPVFFRLMYCCGLRPGETRVILRDDVDFSARSIKIRQSKGNKERLVMMAEDVAALCERYDTIVRTKGINSIYLFPNAMNDYDVLHCDWLFDMFDLCWKNSGIQQYSGNKPRPYDFRHTFATKCLYRWLKEGKDLQSYLPYLSAYMGHEDFSHTAYYIHLVPEYFKQMTTSSFARYEALLPEVMV